MWRKAIFIWLCLSGHCLAGPVGPKRNMPIVQRHEVDMETKESTASAAAATENDTIKPEAISSPAIPNAPNMLMISTLTLPSNATSIRTEITDGFSCANKSYGYYADVENDCQIFHVCLPVTYADGKENLFRWSFICPEETIFSQDSFTCMRPEDMTIDCEESFKYYELNRNFGSDEEENKLTISSSSNSDVNRETLHATVQDQEPAMTTQVLQEHEHATGIDEKPIIPQSQKPVPVMAQKEKPTIQKVQKPNRRKPSPSTIASISNKKKPQNVPLRKVPAPVTAQPVVSTTINTPVAEIETKPLRFTKRPSTLSAHLKEKIQHIKQPEHPATELPSATASPPIRTDLFNQKRKRPSIFNKKETITLKPTEEALGTTTEVIEAVTAEPMKTSFENNAQDPISAQASETIPIVTSPDENNLEPSKPESVAPIEAIEEIPAVITEVEELNTGHSPDKSESEGSSYIVNFPIENTENKETPVAENSPAIFQQNSEESLTPAIEPSIEEMEDQKPNNAPESLPPSSEMISQDPMIDQMLTDTDSDNNKPSMGGFKPVDPAMAAEAEALIANFLNTLMKSEKTNSEPVMPNSADATKTDELMNSSMPEKLSEIEITSDKKPTMTEDNRAPIGPLKPELDQPNTMTMTMNKNPEEELHIPVQVIQDSIEEPKKPQSSAKPEPARPLSIDDVVELVKDKLEQPSDSVVENEKETETSTESVIVPIYIRGSSDAWHENGKVGNPELPAESLTEQSSEPKKNTETNRAESARSIKTAIRMDPRKRRFLFKSDAS